MRKMNGPREKKWVILFLITAGLCLGGTVLAVVSIDPFFHYHAPLTDRYYYVISNQRSQNDGITRHFDYTGLITGSSVTKNFKTSEAEELFSGKFIKIPYDGATYLEIHQSVERALKRNPELKRVIRGLDLEWILYERNHMWADDSFIPNYLLDENVLNDVYYVLNRDVFFTWTCRMLDRRIKGTVAPGVTSFDDYARWAFEGAGAFQPDGLKELVPGEPFYLSSAMEEEVRGTVRQNMTEIADQYPEVEFDYFISPNSMAWWYVKMEEGTAYAIVEAEKVMMEEILQHPNIRLYSWNDWTEICGNLDNYSDSVHYSEWINDLILRNISEGIGLITEENYEERIENELRCYQTFDYLSMMNQT